MNFIKKILNINTSSNYNDIPKITIKKFNNSRPINCRNYICNAPFRNLYFNTDGQVSACCYNMKYMVGNIKNNSISEIWNGEKINNLRKSIANNDFSLGCDTCKAELLNESFENIHIKFFDENYSKSDLPTSFMFQIDNTCNLECTMCTGDFSSKIFTNREQRIASENPYNKSFFKELYTFLPNIKLCMFSGGEPFLINSYFDIWNKIIELNNNCLIVVQTNGTIINEKVKNIINKGNFQIEISLDSLNSETFKKIRVNASIETTLNNIEYFSKINNLHYQRTNISVCVMNQNRFEIPEITKFCSEKELSILYNTVNFPAKDAVWILSSNELKKIIDEFSNYKLPEKNEIQKSNKIKFYDLIKKLKYWYNISLKWESISPQEVDSNLIVKFQEEVISKIKSSLNLFYNNNSISSSLISKIENILNEMPNNNLKLKTLETINLYSGNKILANIYRENDESLKLLINNMAKFSEI